MNEKKKNILYTVIRKIYEYFEERLSFKNVLFTFIGSNLIFLMFQFSVQLRTLFCFDTMDSYNMIANYILGFIIIAFTVIILLHH